jgi:hypothetical protein
MKKMNLTMRSTKDVYSYYKQALDMLDEDHPHYDELSKLLREQVNDELNTIYNSN